MKIPAVGSNQTTRGLKTARKMKRAVGVQELEAKCKSVFFLWRNHLENVGKGSGAGKSWSSPSSVFSCERTASR